MDCRWSRCSCLLLLLLVLLVPAAPQDPECSTDPCLDPPSCTGCVNNDLIADPENCRGYYLCSGGSPTDLPFVCADGQVFDAANHQCVEGTECTECSSGSCAYECPSEGDSKIPFSTDCHSYYECSDGSFTGSFTCEDDEPFFNGAECQADETACCHCRPYCYADDTSGYIADPVDCRNYYYCTAASSTPTVLGTCPEGENFDSAVKQCSATAPCNPACRNVVGSDGCISPFTCLAEGFYAACPGQCVNEFYHCTAATGEYQDPENCYTGTVFHPDDHICVDPDDCP